MATSTLPESKVQEITKRSPKPATKYVYSFGGAKADGHGKMKDGLGHVSEEVDRQMEDALRNLEELQGQKLGKGDNPLLVSVRSGAKFSMPGMMDTILNLGLNDQSVESLAKRGNNPRFAYDSYRRLIQMFGNVVLDVDKHEFEEVFDAKKKQRKAKL